MELKICICCFSIAHLLLCSTFFFTFTSPSASSPTYLSDTIFGNEASIGRNLLQAKTDCPVNFEFLNYTIITSQCKGPKYSPDLCCGAFKEFVCPYVDDVNDLSTDCATTMFSYINLYGKYPPGLFSSECKEGKLGLACGDSLSENASTSWVIQNPKPFLVLSIGLLVLFLPLF